MQERSGNGDLPYRAYAQCAAMVLIAAGAMTWLGGRWSVGDDDDADEDDGMGDCTIWSCRVWTVPKPSEWPLARAGCKLYTNWGTKPTNEKLNSG